MLGSPTVALGIGGGENSGAGYLSRPNVVLKESRGLAVPVGSQKRLRIDVRGGWHQRQQSVNAFTTKAESNSFPQTSLHPVHGGSYSEGRFSSSLLPGNGLIYLPRGVSLGWFQIQLS